MNRVLSITACFGLALMLLCGLLELANPAHADVLKGAQCITSLGNGDCNSTGDSMCSWLYTQDPENCTNACVYCPGNDALPDYYCIAWDGATCTTTGPSTNKCRNGNRLQGGCLAADGDCSCNNPNPNGQGCGTYNIIPCTL
jgi:hypothetical protein